MVANWVLTGDAGGQSLRKLFAGLLAQIAQVATTYAIMCLAAAALATTGFGAILVGGSPHQFLIAAGIFGAIAVTSAIAGRLIAGNPAASKQATAQSTNGISGSSSGTAGGQSGATGSSGGSRNGGAYYSSYGDQVKEHDVTANQPEERRAVEVVRHEINLTDYHGRRSEFVVDTIKTNVRHNGDLRQLFGQIVNDF